MTDSAQIVYLNGKFLPIEAANVNVLDRGFIYGDGVYEVIPVYDRARSGCRTTWHGCSEARWNPARQSASGRPLGAIGSAN